MNEHDDIINIINQLYYSFIPSPKFIINKRCCCITPKNSNDNECFKWCLCIHEALKNNETKDLQRISKLKKYINQNLNNNIEIPIKINTYNIKKIENLTEYSINLFYYENKSIYPLIISKKEVDDNKKINLMILYDTKKKNKHFIYIKNLNALLSKQYTRKFCHYCLIAFKTQKSLNEHKKYGCIYRYVPFKPNFIESKQITSIYKKNILKCISNCKQTDKKKINWNGRGKLYHVGNINYNIIHNLLKKQKFRCYICNDNLAIVNIKPYCCYKFSVDRLNNLEPHDDDNVKISCYYCNCKDHILYNRRKKEKCKDINCICNNKLFDNFCI